MGAQAHLTAQTVLYAVANASPALQAALLRTVVPTLEALWGRTQVTPVTLSYIDSSGCRSLRILSTDNIFDWWI